MDKFEGLIAVICFGIIATVFTLGISGVMDNERFFKGQRDNDSDMRIYIPSRCRNRRGNNGYDKRMGD